MTIEFPCQCGHVSVIPAAAAGRPGRCVACRAVFQVPGAVRSSPGRVPTDLSRLAESWGRVASRWEQIPGMFNFEPVYDAAVAGAKDGAVFVEVGGLVGRSTCYLAAKIRESGKAITLYAVETATGSSSDATGNLIAPALGGSFAGVLHRNIIGCGLLDVVVPILTSSVRAARLFPDGGVDFCFIDGDHSYPSVTADLGAWWPKIRLGGTLGGHDYRQPDSWLVGVTPAVHNFFGVEDATDPTMPSCWSMVKEGAGVMGGELNVVRGAAPHPGRPSDHPEAAAKLRWTRTNWRWLSGRRGPRPCSIRRLSRNRLSPGARRIEMTGCSRT